MNVPWPCTSAHLSQGLGMLEVVHSRHRAHGFDVLTHSSVTYLLVWPAAACLPGRWEPRVLLGKQ